MCATGWPSSAVNYPDSEDSGAGYLVGTRCGRVLSTDVGINTDLCARPGDSGGPLYSQTDHTALGIPIETIITDLNARIASQGSTFTVITTPNG